MDNTHEMMKIISEQIKKPEIYKKKYEYDDEGYGVILYSIEGKDDKTVLLQGDDYSAIMEQIETIDKIWDYLLDNSEGPHSFGPFGSFEEHLDAILSPYFD